MAPTFDAQPIRAILLDVEGTTTPIEFVLKTLFPFASKHVHDFLRRNCGKPDTNVLVRELRAQYGNDRENGADPGEWDATTTDREISSASSYVRWLSARDSKCTVLKTLQGRIWEEGFRTGQLKGEVYPDVPAAFRRWAQSGLQLAIFSSGSVLAQQLLFKHSTAGDLSAFLEAYFDTTTGPKREAESYRKIASALDDQPRHVLFISDVVAELDAAREAGMPTAHSLRPGISPAPDSGHPAITSFSSVL